MTAWSEFLKDVRTAAPALPEPMIVHAVRRATQQFCIDTRAWQVTMEPAYTRKDALEYDIEFDREQELVRIERATLNGQPYAVWRAGREPTHDRYVYTPDMKLVAFAQQPEADLPLVLTCAVKPSNDATGVDDAIANQYMAVIADLAVFRLTGDRTRKADYEAEVDRIKTRLWRGNAAIRPRTRANFF